MNIPETPWPTDLQLTYCHIHTLWVYTTDTNYWPSLTPIYGKNSTFSCCFILTLYFCPHSIYYCINQFSNPGLLNFKVIWTNHLRKETCFPNQFPSTVILKFCIFLHTIETKHKKKKTERERREDWECKR